MKTVFIYALCEPGTRTVRYIGLTGNIEIRLRQHLRISSKKKNHLGFWLRGILSRGAVPIMVSLSEVSANEGASKEIKYIRAARSSLGMDLVNSTDGGDGGALSQESRDKITAALRTPLARSKSRAKAKKRWKNPLMRAKFISSIVAAKSTPEARARTGKSSKERWENPEFRAKMMLLRAARTSRRLAKLSNCPPVV